MRAYRWMKHRPRGEAEHLDFTLGKEFGPAEAKAELQEPPVVTTTGLPIRKPPTRA